MILKYTVEKEMLVKEYLEYVKLSHHLRKKVRALDNIYINGIKSKNYFPLKKGDILSLEFKEELNSEYEANYDDIDKINILYEDEYLMVISKNNDISSQPSLKHKKDNVLSILKGYFIKNNIHANIHLVNRLDYATSGLMLISKSSVCTDMLNKGKIIKKYLAKVKGHLDKENGLIDFKIKREEAPSIKRYVSEDGKEAKTLYKVVKREKETDILELTLLTGRCHQIRVHMSYLGYPILGDKIYGEEDEYLYLHSYYLSFYHPFLLRELEFTCYPCWFKK